MKKIIILFMSKKCILRTSALTPSVDSSVWLVGASCDRAAEVAQRPVCEVDPTGRPHVASQNQRPSVGPTQDPEWDHQRHPRQDWDRERTCRQGAAGGSAVSVPTSPEDGQVRS